MKTKLTIEESGNLFDQGFSANQATGRQTKGYYDWGEWTEYTYEVFSLEGLLKILLEKITINGLDFYYSINPPTEVNDKWTVLYETIDREKVETSISGSGEEMIDAIYDAIMNQMMCEI